MASFDALLGEVTAALGFDYYALADHGELTATSNIAGLLTNYPVTWRRRYISAGFDRIDPVQLACRAQAIGFYWSQLGELNRLRPDQLALLAESRQNGLADGFTVPLHLPGARAASCSFAVRPGRDVPRQARWSAEAVARIGYERRRTLTEAPLLRRTLSPRQRDCIRLLAHGLTDRGIARRLGLSEETVTKYLNAARRRYSVARRAQLVAAALRDGVIGFDEFLVP